MVISSRPAMSNPRSSRRFCAYWQPFLILKILNLTFLMQVVLSTTLSCLYRVLGDFYVSTDNLVQNLLPVFWSLPSFHWH